MNLPSPRVYKKYLSILSRTNDYEARQLLSRAFNTVYLLDSHEDYLTLKRQIASDTASRARVRKYLKGMCDLFPYSLMLLVTLTFTDDVLSSTCFSSRQKYVRCYLNSVFDDWFACVDYGLKNNREHFHAICVLNLLNCPRYESVITRYSSKRFIRFVDSSVLWDYGFMSMRLIDSALSSYSYAFKASGYAFKNKGCKPFHRRGVVHFDCLNSDWVFD